MNLCMGIAGNLKPYMAANPQSPPPYASLPLSRTNLTPTPTLQNPDPMLNSYMGWLCKLQGMCNSVR